jgi:hypothetical protein
VLFSCLDEVLHGRAGQGISNTAASSFYSIIGLYGILSHTITHPRTPIAAFTRTKMSEIVPSWK